MVSKLDMGNYIRNPKIGCSDVFCGSMFLQPTLSDLFRIFGLKLSFYWSDGIFFKRN
jgi:hypothetical protein